MKRKTADEVAATPKKQPRQDPVSCESCRKKKTKCDRRFPCSSCTTRRIDCRYGVTDAGDRSTVVQPGAQMRRDGPSIGFALSQSTSSTKPTRDEAERHSTDDSISTADRLENILMGHRIPTAVPAALREELSRPRHMQASRQFPDTASSSLLMLGRDGIFPSLKNPATINVTSFLPTEAEALRLFNYYHKHLDYQYHLIIPAKMKRQIHSLYDAVASGGPVDVNHIALLFSIFATALSYQLLSSEVAEVCSRETAFLAGAALIQSNYITYPTIEGLQAAMIIAHHLSNLTLNSSVSSLFLHGSLVSQAKSLGLHLLDCRQSVADRREKGFDKTDVELKRRLWWDLASYDWLLSFLSGPQEWTYTIQPQHMNVRRPLNIEDDSIEGETGLPLSTPTCMSYTLQRLKLAETCREIVDVAGPYHLRGQEAPYDTILELDRKIHQAYAELPAFFCFDQSSRRQFARLYRERPEIAWQRALGQQGYHSRICRLHRPYFVRGARDPRYSYSHVVSLQSARKVLEIKRIMDEEEPKFTPNSSYFWAVMHHVFMAAVILLIDVCFNWDDILANKRKEEVLEACKLLSRAQQFSPVAREGINTMMGILRRYWKQEKRADPGEGMQAAPTPPPGLDVSVLLDQSALPTASNAQDFKDRHSDIPANEQNIPIHEPPMDFVNAELGSVPLEDFWSQMLDESAHITLDTPDWTDLLTELTNVTAPSE